MKRIIGTLLLMCVVAAPAFALEPITDADLLYYVLWDIYSNQVLLSALVGTTNLVDLMDVHATTPSVNDVLTWDGTYWTNLPAGGSMDYAAVDGASNLALAAYGMASNNAAGVAAVGAVATNAALSAGAAGVDSTNALVRVQGLGADLTNRWTAGYTPPAWNGANLTNLPGSAGGIGPEVASNSFIIKTGDGAITGPLGQDAGGAGIIVTTSTERAFIGSTGGAGVGSVVLGDGGGNQNYWTAIGWDQVCTGDGNGGVQIGYDARAGKRSIAVGLGTRAQGSSGYGVAVGHSANADEFGAVCGSYGSAANYGAALGYEAKAIYNGIAVGASSWGTYGATAVGRGAMAVNTNIAIGYLARAYGVQRVSIGTSVSNKVDNSTAVRGDLYLDGATGIYTRATFGSGEFVANIIFDHAATQIIFQCGGVTWTNKP